MDVFFKTQNGLKFCMELGYWDTVLAIKKKINKYHRIPVSTQTLFFKGNVLQDHLDIEQCKILHNSQVTVLVSKDQVLQPKQPPTPSESIGDIIYGEDFPLKTEDFENIQSFLPPDETQGIIYGNQDSAVTVQTEESTPSSDSIINVKDSPMKRVAVRVLLPYSGESNSQKSFPLFVNRTDHVRKLRTLVHNRQRDQSRLHNGYFFRLKERILFEDKSFEWNGIGQFSTIEIVPDPWL